MDTLKLVAHLRDVRDGKADQDLFHDCIAWLWQEHPLTLLANLDEIIKVTTATHARKETRAGKSLRDVAITTPEGQWQPGLRQHVHDCE